MRRKKKRGAFEGVTDKRVNQVIGLSMDALIGIGVSDPSPYQILGLLWPISRAEWLMAKYFIGFRR